MDLNGPVVLMVQCPLGLLDCQWDLVSQGVLVHISPCQILVHLSSL